MRLPVELQYRILELADWDQQPLLGQVCSSWRRFLLSSPLTILNRYSPAILTTTGSISDTSTVYCHRPRFHRIVTYLTHFTQHTPPSTTARVIHPCHIDYECSLVTFFTGTGLPNLGPPSSGLDLKPPFVLSTLSVGFFANDTIILPSDASSPSSRFHPHAGYLRFYSRANERPAIGVLLGLSKCPTPNPPLDTYIRSLVHDIQGAHYFSWPRDFRAASVLKLITRLCQTEDKTDGSDYLVFKLECDDDIPKDPISGPFPSKVLAIT